MVEPATTDDPVLKAAVEAVRAHYGDRVESIVLFGSRARGDHGPESDYDIAVFLRDLDDYWGEVRALALISHDLLLLHGEVVSVKPFTAGERQTRTLLMHDIRTEGRAL
jgi:uncharacterized protein